MQSKVIIPIIQNAQVVPAVCFEDFPSKFCTSLKQLLLEENIVKLKLVWSQLPCATLTTLTLMPFLFGILMKHISSKYELYCLTSP
jgi:hypothetical protein